MTGGVRHRQSRRASNHRRLRVRALWLRFQRSVAPGASQRVTCGRLRPGFGFSGSGQTFGGRLSGTS